MRQYVSYHKIEQLTIIPFNYRMLDSVFISAPYASGKRWWQFLEQFNYDGPTRLGAINVTGSPDLVLIFTDGISTYGNNRETE